MATSHQSPTSLHEALFRWVVTGLAFLTLGFTSWFALLAAEFVTSFIQVSQHMHEKGYRPWSIQAEWITGVGYGTAFCGAGWVIARMGWHHRPAVAVVVAYAAFLIIYLPTLDWNRALTSSTFSLLIPLITSPLGAWLGQRLFAKSNLAQVRTPICCPMECAAPTTPNEDARKA